jgi:hypothetical protein
VITTGQSTTIDNISVTLEEWASAETIVPVAQIAVEPDDFPFLHDFWGYNPELLAGRHVWTNLDRDNRELFPIRPRRVYS